MSLQYKSLVVWQRADDLFVEIHRLRHQQFPRDEQYELGRQLRLAAYSVPANIVEGFARQHARDTINFFNIASASLSELTYGLPTGSDIWMGPLTRRSTTVCGWLPHH